MRNQIEYDIVTSALTDVGLKRKVNEDNYFVSDDKRLLLVADGMGGYQGGETASRIIAETAKKLYNPSQLDDPEGLLTSIVDESYNEMMRVYQKEEDDIKKESEIAKRRTRSNPYEKMGSTLVAVLLDNQGKANFLNIGDSRAYIMRSQKMYQITEDDSFVNQFREKYTNDQGVFESDEDEMEFEKFISQNLNRNIILKCIGRAYDKPTVEIKSFKVEEGDLITLGSDGVFDMLVHRSKYEQVLWSALPYLDMTGKNDFGGAPSSDEKYQQQFDEANKLIITESLRYGGDDNITHLMAIIRKIELTYYENSSTVYPEVFDQRLGMRPYDEEVLFDESSPIDHLDKGVHTGAAPEPGFDPGNYVVGAGEVLEEPEEIPFKREYSDEAVELPFENIVNGPDEGLEETVADSYATSSCDADENDTIYDNLKNQLATLRNENKRLKNVIRASDEIIGTYLETVSDLNREISVYKRTIKENSDCISISEENERLAEIITNLTAQKVELKEQIYSLNIDVRDKQEAAERVFYLEGELANAKDRIWTLKVRDELFKVQKRRDYLKRCDLEKNVDNLTARIEGLKGLEQENTNLRRQTESRDREISAGQQRLKEVLQGSGAMLKSNAYKLMTSVALFAAVAGASLGYFSNISPNQTNNVEVFQVQEQKVKSVQPIAPKQEDLGQKLILYQRELNNIDIDFVIDNINCEVAKKRLKKLNLTFANERKQNPEKFEGVEQAIIRSDLDACK